MNSLYVQDNFYPDLNEFPVRTRQLLPGSKWISCTYKTTFTQIYMNSLYAQDNFHPDLNEFTVRTRQLTQI